MDGDAHGYICQTHLPCPRPKPPPPHPRQRAASYGMRFNYTGGLYYDECAVRNVTSQQLGGSDTAVDVNALSALSTGPYAGLLSTVSAPHSPAMHCTARSGGGAAGTGHKPASRCAQLLGLCHLPMSPGADPPPACLCTRTHCDVDLGLSPLWPGPSPAAGRPCHLQPDALQRHWGHH
jgi:hypothetical protein